MTNTIADALTAASRFSGLLLVVVAHHVAMSRNRFDYELGGS
jgi:hypothetical protein